MAEFKPCEDCSGKRKELCKRFKTCMGKDAKKSSKSKKSGKPGMYNYENSK